MARDPLIELGIRLLGPPANLSDEDVERAERVSARAEKALEEKKEVLRLLAPTDRNAATELRSILSEEIAQIEANMAWMRRLGATDPDAPSVRALQVLEQWIAERESEMKRCDGYLVQSP